MSQYSGTLRSLCSRSGFLPRIGLLFIVATAVLGCSPPQSAQASPSAGQASNPVASATPERPGDGLAWLLNPTPSGQISHQATDFTQGLLFSDGSLFESTGRRNESKVRRINPTTGAIEKTQELPGEYFGEGLASLDGRLYQLTWTSGVCLIYDQATLKPESDLFYSGQGWGLTVSPEEKLLVFSDGSATLRFLDPTNLIARRRVTVTDGQGQDVSNLNELEWVRGEVWANVWMTDRIARIDPQTGKVKSWLLLTDLETRNHKGAEDVLNGIAYDPTSDQLWLTGKLWSAIYRFDNVEQTFFAPAETTPKSSPSPRK